MLPGKEGVTILKELKAHEKTSHIPVIMISAKTKESDIVEALSAGANEYICKPIKIDELILRIERMKGTH